ncbi:Dolichyldiphosphatase 1 [Hypsizygus marmoreus]|uniref:Dolichyldiphosphatase 1 n=1 Tax=Hypsizygus marmoreus TaxID=39966 RepID=A0A369JSW1_HYPMA|nr:Dolichyldiphosphatase 1 [Hypsizygus marmoreus]
MSFVDDDSSLFSLALALITLSPILLMASYAALVVQTREYVIIVMWAGQLAGEVLNWILKHAIKEGRPIESIGNGYGFPSSHSQYMAYFASFLICHLYFRHRFASTGFWILDYAWRVTIYFGLIAWSGMVAYSRFYLGYHNANQILWGVGIGIALGVTLYSIAELVPRRRPASILGTTKRSLLNNPISTWLQIRDGWAVWADGGREGEWIRWKAQWDKQEDKRTQ